MAKIEGFFDVKPKIRNVTFPKRGRIAVSLFDGRSIDMPISAFPSVKKLNSEQRKKWFTVCDGFSFEDSNEVIHIEQIFGDTRKYFHEIEHSIAAEPETYTYKTKK